MKEWKLASGEIVVDRYNSHLKKEVIDLLSEVLAKVESANSTFLREEVELGRIVGNSTCIQTGSSDKIVYAQRPKRWGKTRFVADRVPEPCSKVTVILKKAENEPETYVLITSFIGELPEPEPWDKRNFQAQPDPAEAERRAREFWSCHALVWGSEEIITDTESTRCPW